MKKHTNNRFISCLIGTALLTLVACSSNNDAPISIEADSTASTEGNYELTGKQFESSNMKLGKLEMKEFHNVVKANGVFDVPPKNRASVSSYFGGTVKEIQLLPGERVKKGQLLFVLENPDYIQLQQDYLEAKEQLSYLKSDYEREKKLVADNVTSEKNYLKSEADYTVTRVRVESLGKKLKLMNINPNTLTTENIRTTIYITSPINGYITAINISRGIFLNPSQTAISLVDIDHLHLELNIFEKDLPKIKVGQEIEFRIEEDNNKRYKASVYLVNKTIDPENRTIGVHGHLADDKSSNTFNPGMYVEAEIYTSSESKASLPQNAIVELDNKAYVLVLENKSDKTYSFVQKEVKTGTSNNGYVEILNAEDFNENTAFLTIGAFNLITE